MFKKFTQADNVTSVNLVKSSVQRAIRNAIAEQYPLLGGALDDILPKKKLPSMLQNAKDQ